MLPEDEFEFIRRKRQRPKNLYETKVIQSTPSMSKAQIPVLLIPREEAREKRMRIIIIALKILIPVIFLGLGTALFIWLDGLLMALLN